MMKKCTRYPLYIAIDLTWLVTIDRGENASKDYNTISVKWHATLNKRSADNYITEVGMCKILKRLRLKGLICSEDDKSEFTVCGGWVLLKMRFMFEA